MALWTIFAKAFLGVEVVTGTSMVWAWALTAESMPRTMPYAVAAPVSSVTASE
ncbi:hypothetical protein OG937_11000 [Streptomyces sp. NBC_00510]